MDPTKEKSSWNWWSWFWSKKSGAETVAENRDIQDQSSLQVTDAADLSLRRTLSAPTTTALKDTNEIQPEEAEDRPLKTTWTWKPNATKQINEEPPQKFTKRINVPKAQSERLLRPRGLEIMKKVLPVDEDDFEGDEKGDWSSYQSSDEEDHPNELIDSGYVNDDIDDLLHDPDAHLVNMAFTPYAFIIACSFLIIWGILGTCSALILEYVQTDSMEFLMLDKKFTSHPPTYFLLATVLSIVCGILGLLSLSFDMPLILEMIPFLLTIICAFSLMAAITAAGSLGAPTKSTYARLFESVILYDHEPKLLKSFWPGVKPNIWDRIQTTMKCCGFSDPSDWLNVPYNATVPASCCSGTEDLCKSRLSELTIGKSTSEELTAAFQEIKPMIYATGCLEVISFERSHRIHDWIIYPSIFFVFHLLLMIQMNYLTRLLLKEYQSWDGKSRLAIFRATNIDVFKIRLARSFWSIFKCIKKCRNKMDTADETLSRMASESHIYDTEPMANFSGMSSSVYKENLNNSNGQHEERIGKRRDGYTLDAGLNISKSASSTLSGSSVRSSVQVEYRKRGKNREKSEDN